MLNSVKKGLGYRDIIYNIRSEKFFTYSEGDSYEGLDIAAGRVGSGGTADRPSEPEIGDLFWDTDTDLLIIWNGNSWEPVSPPQGPGQWTRTGTTLAPTNPGDTVAVTAADGTENITLNADGSASFVADATINSLTIGRGAGNISSNTANGYRALYSNTTGLSNVANGYAALISNTTGSNNTADGVNALFNNTTGSNNTANGKQALYYNTTGASNTADGVNALYYNTTGVSNVANGVNALRSNTTGSNNTANGLQALYSNTTGSNNTADGVSALYYNTTGGNNTANGKQALYYNTTGSGNIGIGFLNNAGTYAPVFDPTTEDNRLVLGHTAITNAYVQVAWTVTSDERDKMNFAPVPYGLDFVNQLKPTAYQFKVDRDTETPNGDVRYGFKAQDILALEGDNPVIIDTEDADHLKYKGEHLVPVLVNAVQELTAMVKELQTEIKTLKG